MGVTFSQAQVKPRQLQAIKSIKVLSPNGGENWEKGKIYTIRWQSHGISGNVKIKLKWGTSSGGWFTVTNSTPNTGRYSYTIPRTVGQAGNQFKIYVMTLDESVKDKSDGFFSISQIKVIYPNGGETFYRGGQCIIRWQSSGITGNVAIIIMKDNRALRKVQKPNTGSFIWGIPTDVTGYNVIPLGSHYKIKVKALDFPVSDQSDGYFKVREITGATTGDIDINPMVVYIGRGKTRTQYGELVEPSKENFTTMIPKDKNSKYWKVVFPLTFRVKNVGSMAKTVTANVYYKNHLVNTFDNIATLAPGEVREVSLPNNISWSTKKGKPFKFKLVVNQDEAHQKGISFKNNTFIGFLNVIDYSEIGIKLDPNYIHLGKTNHMIIFQHGEGKTLHPADVNYFDALGQNKFRIKFDIRFRAKNTAPDNFRRVQFNVLLGDKLVRSVTQDFGLGERKNIAISNLSCVVDLNKNYEELKIRAMNTRGGYIKDFDCNAFIKFSPY